MPSEAMSEPAQACPRCGAEPEKRGAYEAYWKCDSNVDYGKFHNGYKCLESQLADLRAQLEGAQRERDAALDDWPRVWKAGFWLVEKRDAATRSGGWIGDTLSDVKVVVEKLIEAEEAALSGAGGAP